jgi:glycosyltransferase involved in cell wall biosynthesis
VKPLPEPADPAPSRSLPRVVVDLEKLRHINTGLGRFSLHLGRELLRLAPGRYRPVFFLPPAAERHFPAGGFERITAAEWKKESLRRFVRPLVRPLLPRPAFDLWHVSNQASKYMPLDARIPVVLTIHDLNFLHEGPRESRRWEIGRKLAAVQRRIDRAAAVVTVSKFTADDVRGHLDLGSKPVHVVPNGMAPPPAASPVRPGFLGVGPFLLAVGNVLPHKNFQVLIGLMEQLPDRRLVIAGKKTTRCGAAIEREIARRGLGGRVIMPGEVSDGDRQWLYEHCDAFLFPSLAEGFGFPVLEAMQCGKPVFLSRATSLPEVAGEHGFYFESYEPSALKRVLLDGLRRVEAQPSFATAVRDHAARYCWAATARQYLDIYLATARAAP